MASGIVEITTVTDLGGGQYQLDLDAAVGISAGDHFGGRITDPVVGPGAVYEVDSVNVPLNRIVVNDTLTEENGGQFGPPVEQENAWYTTPTANDYTPRPHRARGWGAAGRRNEWLADDFETSHDGRLTDLEAETTGPDGETAARKFSSQVLSGVSGSSVTASGVIPDGALVLAVTTLVKVALGTSNGTTGYDVGDGSDQDHWGADIDVLLGTQSDPTDFTTNPILFQSGGAGDVVLTPKGGDFDGTGEIRVSVAYLEFTPPTS